MNRRSNTIESEILSFLESIEKGTIHLVPLNDPQLAVQVVYNASNGWRICVFNDSGVWDYIEWIETSENEAFSFEDLKSLPAVDRYQPSRKVQKEAYGIYWGPKIANRKEKVLYEDRTSPLLVTDISTEIRKYLTRHPEKLYDLSPRAFEVLIADILTDFGFDTEITQATRDGGKDIYATIRNAVTSFVMFVECKKYSPSNKVGIGVVQRVYGAAKAAGAHKSMIVTTSFFTDPALAEADRISRQMELKDFNHLKSWLAQCRRR